MLVRLTETVGAQRGYLKGTIHDLQRATITGICESLGRRDWFEPVTTVESAAGLPPGVLPRRRKEATSG